MTNNQTVSLNPGLTLFESEARFSSIVETIEDPYYEVDLRGNLTLYNSAFCRLLGYSMAELAGANNRQFQTEAAAAHVYKTFNTVFRTGTPSILMDWELIRKDGSRVVGEGSVQLVRNLNGEAVGFRGILRDVTAHRKMEQALRASEEKHRSILETSTEAYFEVNLKGDLITCNGSFCRMLGYAADELIGKNYRHQFQSPEVADNVFLAFNQVYLSGEAAKCFDWAMRRKDGRIVVGEGSVQLLRDMNGEPVGFCGFLRDVTERRQMEQALRESEARFRALTNLSSDWYWEQDAAFRYTRMDSRHGNADTLQLSFIGKQPWEIGLDIDAPDGWKSHRDVLSRREPFRDVVMHCRLADGRPYYISVSGEPVFAANGKFAGYRGVSREITDQRIAEERIHHLATHDGLTGLPNRLMFGHLLSTAILTAQRNKGSCAVLILDLDRFKFINDTFGHEVGDKLLMAMTSRFNDVLRSGDVIARLGGDEFVVLIQGGADATHAVTVARKLLSAATEPVMLTGRECRVTASIGIAMYPRDGENEQTLMKNADIAMYFAKEEGKNNFQFYSKNLRTQSLERLVLENNLRHALERAEFSLQYQAKRDLANGRITGVEALIRWNNLELGSVSPVQFIPVAEETGLIIEIGKWVLKTACAQNMEWQRMGLPPISMAVNLSARQFRDEHLLDDIATILAETGMPSHLLELEITESMVVHHPEHALKLLTDIKKMGLRLAIDDFGTGYSSLGQLKHFPVDTLKVDRSFIRDLATNPEDRAITEAIIAMGKTLKMTVVAEGVETKEQKDFLLELACDEMQGYYFSKPLPPDEFMRLLADHAAGTHHK